MKALTIFFKGFVVFLCAGVALYAFSYLWIHHGFLTTKGEIANQTGWQIAFHMHFLGGGIALAVGWAQFWSGLRNRYIRLHRTIGFIYVASVFLAGGPGGLYLSFFANGGFSASLGFCLLGLGWIFTTAKALGHIRRTRIEDHKVWMIRSYALCMAAVTLRLWLPIFVGILEVPFAQAYQAIAWFCWVPNLIAAEWVIDRGWIRA